MNEIFIADTAENVGKNWLIADFGTDSADNKTYILTSNHMHASDFAAYDYGSRVNAELAAKLLNAYYHVVRNTGKLATYNRGEGEPGDNEADLYAAIFAASMEEQVNENEFAAVAAPLPCPATDTALALAVESAQEGEGVVK